MTKTLHGICSGLEQSTDCKLLDLTRGINLLIYSHNEMRGSGTLRELQAFLWINVFVRKGSWNSKTQNWIPWIGTFRQPAKFSSSEIKLINCINWLCRLFIWDLLKADTDNKLHVDTSYDLAVRSGQIKTDRWTG